MYGSQGTRQLAYAPTPSIPRSALNANINLDEEVKLFATAAERDLMESLAEVYSIIVALEGIEKAYQKDAISEDDYTRECSKLLKQYKSILADESVAEAFVDLDTFQKEWDIECPRATQRLRIGISATVEQGPNHKPTPQGDSTDATLVMNATEDFITLLDALKLGLTEKDTLHPYLVEVVQGVNRVTDKDFDSKGKMVQWLITLNQMRASEKLSDDQTRDFLFDMEQAYHGFKGTFKKD